MDSNINCKMCTLMAKNIESLMEENYVEEYNDLIEKFHPLHNLMKPYLTQNQFKEHFLSTTKFTCEYLTNFCSKDSEVLITSFNKTANSICDTCLMNVEQFLNKTMNNLMEHLIWVEEHGEEIAALFKQECSIFGQELSEICFEILNQLGSMIEVYVFAEWFIIYSNIDYWPKEFCQSLSFC